MNKQLDIYVFGGFEVQIEGKPLSGFRSRKVSALLANLAAHPRPQPRETLAEILWEERTQTQSLSNLRVVLSDLKKILGDYLDIQRDRVGLKWNENVWTDIGELNACLDGRQLEKAIEIYRGDFLQNYFVPDARKFDEWAAVEREKYKQKIVAALQRVITIYCQYGVHTAALVYARRLVELDRLNEIGHLEQIRHLALTGQRCEAMARYTAYRKMLQEELGVEPLQEIEDLYLQIRAGKLDAATDAFNASPTEWLWGGGSGSIKRTGHPPFSITVQP
jgi:DNA-binding SARP family transcriptional activator